MRRVTLIALLAILMATSAPAMNAFLDTNGDEKASFEEMIAIYPGLTEAVFVALDFDADGFLKTDEIASAVDAYIIGDPDGDI